MAVGLLIDRDHFFRAWLVAYMLFLGIALGSLALMMIQHLSGGTWGVFRRIFEASSRTLPLLAVLVRSRCCSAWGRCTRGPTRTTSRRTKSSGTSRRT